MTGDEKCDDEKKHGELRTYLLSGWREETVFWKENTLVTISKVSCYSIV